MDASYLENKILNLQARLMVENEASQRDNIMNDLTINALCSPRHTTNRRPKQLLDLGTPTRPRKQLNLPVNVLMQPKSKETTEVDSKMKEIMKLNGMLNINGKKYHTDIKALEQLGELGNGTCGQVVKMLHKPSQTVIAVKQMRRSGNSDENKRIIMDLDVVFKSLDCPYIVSYLGCFITESDVWLCMELMATCFDRLLKKLKTAIPEDILGKVTLATVKALDYLKESHGVIHRDVKPSNILLDERGNVKLCDFGISGRLVDSKAKTKNAGCAAYMAPERIEPPDPRKPDYDIRADVWSLGITLVELATGNFPYKDCKCDFEVLSRVLNEDPPSLPRDPSRFTTEFQSFVASCLTKDYSVRPKYKKLLQHPFIKRYEIKEVNVAEWYAKAVGLTSSEVNTRYLPTSLSSSTRRQPPPSSDRSRINDEIYDDYKRFVPIRPNDESFKLVERSQDSSDRDSYYIGSPNPTRRYQPRESPYNQRENAYVPRETTSMLPREPSYTHRETHFPREPPYANRETYAPRDPPYANREIYAPQDTSFAMREALYTPREPTYTAREVNYVPRNVNHRDSRETAFNLSTRNEGLNNYNVDVVGNRIYGANSESTSPLVLQRFYHQQSQHLTNHHGNSYPYTHTSSHYRSASLSPSRNYITESSKYIDDVLENPAYDSPKKRFSSYLKFNLERDDSRMRSPPTIPSRHTSPSPAPPSPPPRQSRATAYASSVTGSPLSLRRNYESSCSPSAVRRLLSEASPSLSRRYVSAYAPQPPPRRLSDSNSPILGTSPNMHYRRNNIVRNAVNKLQYTPQPQRRPLFQMTDL